ncbi:MAG: sugar transferase [Bacilli bacterium]|nr:sugar transferase [Bacilli bacterium]
MNQVLTKEKVSFKNTYFFINRLFDIIVGLLGILALIPLSLIVKVINIVNKDYDKIFYTQDRIGKNGKVFKLYKFRSMVPNADLVLKELLKDEKYKKEWDLNQKFENDPRITKAGNFLRKTSLDELPQFINVLKGDMSLIGPRPLIKGELDSHNGNHEIYESVKPGITGWWACNGRSNLDYDKRLELEYYYAENCSLILDIKCIFKTIKSVICKDGAK